MHKLLQTWLSWKMVPDKTTSSVIRHLMRLPVHHHSEEECKAACLSRCNPHTPQSCKSRCPERCKEDAETVHLLKKLAHRASKHHMRHDLMRHARKHFFEVHPSHHQAAQHQHTSRADYEEQAHQLGRKHGGSFWRSRQKWHDDKDSSAGDNEEGRYWERGRHHSKGAEEETSNEAPHPKFNHEPLSVHPLAMPAVMSFVQAQFAQIGGDSDHMAGSVLAARMKRWLNDCYTLSVLDQSMCIPQQPTTAPDLTVIAGVLAFTGFTLTVSPSLAQVSVAGVVRIGSGTSQLPLVSVTGTLDTSGVSQILGAGSDVWSLLDSFPSVQVSGVDVSLMVQQSGAVQLEVTHVPINVAFIPGYLEVHEFSSITFVTVTSAAELISSPATLRTEVSGVVQVGGLAGFQGNVSGTFDTSERSASLVVSHFGGWSPVPSLMDYFATPAFTCSVAFGVGGVRLALGCNAAFVSPIQIVPDTIELIAHPTSSAAGVEFNVALRQERNESAHDWSVVFAGGLKLSFGTVTPPVLGVRGEISSNDCATLYLNTYEEWVPLPGPLSDLVVPILNGSLALCNGSISATLTHEPIDFMALVPGLFELAALKVGPILAPYLPLPELSSWLTGQGLGDLSTALSAANIGSLTELAALDTSALDGLGITGDVQSTLLVALQRSLNANLPTSSMALALPFDLTLSAGKVDDLDLDALRARLLELVPSATDLQLTAPSGGPDVGVKFVLPDTASLTAVISSLSGLDVGSLSTSLGVEIGSYDLASVAADFFVSALPLPGDLSEWLSSQGLGNVMGPLQGASITSLPELAALSVDDLTVLGLPALSRDKLLDSLTAILPPLPISLPDLSEWLEQYDLSDLAPKFSAGGVTSLDALKLLSPSALSGLSLSSAEMTSVLSALARTLASMLPEPSLRASFSSDVLIGGSNGFAATVSGTIDTDEGSASLTVEHSGGWCPVPSLEDYFSTPAFVGSVAFGVGGVRLALSCDAAFLEPIVLVPDMVEVTAHPQSSAAGVEFNVALTQETNESAYDWSVAFAGGLKLSFGTVTPPVLGVRGEMSSDGPTTLYLNTYEEWAPLPGPLSGLVVPIMNGTFVFNNGTVSATLTHEPVDFMALVPGFFELAALHVSPILAPYMPLPDLSKWLTKEGLSDIESALSGASVRSLTELAALDTSALDGLGITGDVQSTLLAALQRSLTAQLPTSSMALSLSLVLTLAGTLEEVDEDVLRSKLLALVPSAQDVQLTLTPGSSSVSGVVKFVLADDTAVMAASTLLSGMDAASLTSDLEMGILTFDLASTAQQMLVSALPLPEDLTEWLSSQGLSDLRATIQGASITSMAELAALSSADLTALGLPALKLEKLLSSLTAILPPLPVALPDLSGWLDQYGLSAIAPKLSTGGITSVDAIKLLSLSALSDLSLSSAEVTSVISALTRTLASLVPTPQLRGSFTSDVVIGGSHGFEATVSGVIDTEAGSATLTVEHAGGWEPIPGVSFLVTPAFSGDFALGVPNGPHIAVSAAAAWLGPVELGTSLVALVAHPASSSPGMKLAVELTQQEQGGAYEYLLTAEGGLRLFGDGPRAPPVLGLAGSISSSGDASFTFETVEEWVPLAGILVR